MTPGTFLFSFADNIVATKDKVTQLQTQQSECADTLRDTNASMRSQLAVHHQLVSDVRSVLKTMANVSISYYHKIISLFD